MNEHLSGLDTLRKTLGGGAFGVLVRQRRQIEQLSRLLGPLDRPIPGSELTPLRPLPPARSETVIVPRDDVVEDWELETREWLAEACPTALRRMEGAQRRLSDGDVESLAQAMSSCRRALIALADAFLPPGPGKQKDHRGRLLVVNSDAYRNRFFLYLEQQIESGTDRCLTRRTLDDWEVWMRAFGDSLTKGVKEDICATETQQLYLLTWLVLSRIKRFLG